jgi:hypothetical protein
MSADPHHRRAPQCLRAASPKHGQLAESLKND